MLSNCSMRSGPWGAASSKTLLDQKATSMLRTLIRLSTLTLLVALALPAFADEEPKSFIAGNFGMKLERAYRDHGLAILEGVEDLKNRKDATVQLARNIGEKQIKLLETLKQAHGNGTVLYYEAGKPLFGEGKRAEEARAVLGYLPANYLFVPSTICEKGPHADPAKVDQPCWTDPQGIVCELLGDLGSTPTMIIMDPQGTITYRGPLPTNFEHFEPPKDSPTTSE